MQVVIVEPKKKPMVQDVGSDLESMQKIVSGSIEAIYTFEEPVALICNEEGKLLNLPLNRALRDDAGKSMTSFPARSFSVPPRLTVTTLQA